MGTGMGWMCRELCRWELGGTSGVGTDDSETFRLDNLRGLDLSLRRDTYATYTDCMCPAY